MTKVSVVTISFNQAEFLEAAMTSVLQQEGVELEYIVLDPGSTDGSRDIIERYRDRLAHVVLEKDKGPADGLNRGLALATGELFYYLNSDDVVLPGALARAAQVFAGDPGLAVVYGPGRIIDEAGKTVRRVTPPRMHPFLYAYGASYILQQSSVMRTDWLRKAGGFNVENRTCWDGEAFLNIALAGGRFRRIPQELGLFRLYANSISGSGRTNDQYRRDHARLFRKVMGRDWNGWPDRAIGAAALTLSRLSDPAVVAARLRS